MGRVVKMLEFQTKRTLRKMSMPRQEFEGLLSEAQLKEFRRPQDAPGAEGAGQVNGETMD